MTSLRYLVRTNSQGRSGGSPFDDTPSAEIISRAAIRQIDISHDTRVRSITVYYVDDIQTPVRHGGADGKVDSIVLEQKERIIGVEGVIATNVIDQLTFVSNKRRYGPFGTDSDLKSTFRWSTEDLYPPHTPGRYGLLCFSGTADTWLRTLRGTFVDYSTPTRPPEIVRYEELLKGEYTTSDTTRLSAFTRNLMSPIVTLHVGPERLVFRAYEENLCQLSFFSAALHGSFKEAAEKVISMPDDNPEAVSALIEFLYTGKYTYPYTRSTKAEPPQPGDVAPPPSHPDEGEFHISLYMLACKYDYPQLAAGAKAAFVHMLKGLRGIDVVRVWKSAYANGYLLPDSEKDKDFGECMKELAYSLGDVYETHREEMESTIAEWPALGSDVLRLVLAGVARKGW